MLTCQVIEMGVQVQLAYQQIAAKDVEIDRLRNDIEKVRAELELAHRLAEADPSLREVVQNLEPE